MYVFKHQETEPRNIAWTDTIIVNDLKTYLKRLSY